VDSWERPAGRSQLLGRSRPRRTPAGRRCANRWTALPGVCTGVCLYAGPRPPRQARLLAKRALTLTQQPLGPDDPTIGDYHDELGRVLRGPRTTWPPANT